MLECCSIVTWCILSAIMLLIADSCHSCFACHLQTVHSFPVVFILISTEIISSFQWHACQVTALFIIFLPEHAYASHIISRISYMFCVILLVHFPWLIVAPLLVFLFWVDPGDEFVNEEPVEYAYEDQAFDNSENLQARWPPLEITSIFALLVVRSIAMLRYYHLLYHASHIAMSRL